MIRPTGCVRLWQNNVVVFEQPNLVVNAGLPAFARLAAGATAGEYVSEVGFGSGNTPPTLNDTDLTGPQKYYNGVGGATFPSPGTVTFSFALSGTDYAAVGLTVQELGLFANTSAVLAPATVGFPYPAWVASTIQPVGNLVQDTIGHPFRSVAPPAWVASTAVVTGQLITDSNGNVQQVSTAGTTGATNPSWSTIIGSTTADASVVWTCVGLGGYAPASGQNQPTWNTNAIGNFTWDNTVAWQFLAGLASPQPMIAHAVVPAFEFGGQAGYSGTWSLTF